MIEWCGEIIPAVRGVAAAHGSQTRLGRVCPGRRVTRWATGWGWAPLFLCSPRVGTRVRTRFRNNHAQNSFSQRKK
eukprot:6704864-Prymnesium_polylepis.1